MTDGSPMRVSHTRFRGDRTFTYPVTSVEEGTAVMELLRSYDTFNARFTASAVPAEQKLEVQRGENWVEWSDPRTGDKASGYMKRPSARFAIR